MKTTTVKCYLKSFNAMPTSDLITFGNKDFYLLIGEEKKLVNYIEENKSNISNYYLEYDHKNSLMPLSDISKFNARIEPGAIIRDNVEIEDDAIILMGAVINCGAKIGRKTMIDMNAVVGSGAKIGNNCHIGAGAVIAGILEPKSNHPVIIEDHVFIGANAVVLEGVHLYEGSVVGAGAVVIKDVLKNQTVVGVPAKVIKENTVWELNEELR